MILLPPEDRSEGDREPTDGPGQSSHPQKTTQTYYDLLYYEVRSLARGPIALSDEYGHDALDRILGEIQRAHGNPFKLFGDYSVYASISASTARFRQNRPGLLSTLPARERYMKELALREKVELIAKNLLPHAEPKMGEFGGINAEKGSFTLSSEYFHRI